MEVYCVSVLALVWIPQCMLVRFSRQIQSLWSCSLKVREQDGPLCCSDKSREQLKVSHRHVASTWEYGSRIWILKLFIIAVLFWKKQKKGRLLNEQRVKQVQQQPLSSIWAHRRHVKVNQTQRVMTRLVQHRRDSDNTLSDKQLPVVNSYFVSTAHYFN